MVDRQKTLDGEGRTGVLPRRKMSRAAAPVAESRNLPDALRISLGIVRNSDHPMLIWWGDDLAQFYNDAFGKIAWPGSTRAAGPGTSGKTSFLWPIFASDIEHVRAGKGAVSRERRLLPVAANDEPLDRYWTYSLSPINDRKKVAGMLLVCRDETAEQRAALASLAREHELLRVQQIGRIGGLEVELTSGFRNRRSPGYLEIHGLPPEAASETHENWVRRIHSEDRLRAENTFIDAVKGDCSGYSIQYRIIRPSDGKHRWISAKTEIERDGAGRAMRLIGVHSDATDQIDVHAVERARFTAALDLLRCSVLLTDVNGGIVYMNRSAEDLLNVGASIQNRYNVIRATRPSASRELSEALKLAARADTRIGKAGLIVKLSGHDASPVVAHILPLARPEFRHEMEQPAVAAIFVRDQDDTHDSAELLAATYDLTPAEARVLASLLAGRTLAEAAGKLTVALSTVKSHLKVIFQKTGTGRQSELILLASRLSAPVLAS